MNRRMASLSGLVWIFALISLASGCKKGGPAQPYDSKLPDHSGNMMVLVERGGVAQSPISIKITDNLNQVFQGVTDFTGTWSFDYDYKKTSADQADPSFSIQLPEQEHYAATTCTFAPKDGPNTFIFSNNPTLAVTQTLGAPTSYAYNVTNNIWYTCVYDKGGNAEIPVSIVAMNVPSGWGVNYETQILGAGVTQSSVTFVIPQNEYRQNPLTVYGYFLKGIASPRFAESFALKIKRGFQVGLEVTSVQSTIPNVSTLHTNCVLLSNAGFGLNSTNGVNIPWNYDYELRGLDENGNPKLYIQKSGTYTGSGLVTWNVGSFNYYVQLNTNMSEIFTISNPDVGTYTFSGNCIGTGSNRLSGLNYSQSRGVSYY